jgi:4-hydroxy-tetrahydrodipicolinate reductase
VRVGFYGAGAMAHEIATALELRGHESVAALDVRCPQPPLDAVHVETLDELVASRPDVVVHATPRDGDLRRELLDLISAGCDVVSISGVSNLAADDPTTAGELDAAAREHGVRLIGTGLNPGFVQDVVPIFFAGACVRVDKIRARRLADLSVYGQSVLDMYGIGLSASDYRAAVAEGRLVLHREIRQSVDLIAKALGLPLERIDEVKEPVLKEGVAVGYRHRAYGRPAIELEVQGSVEPIEGGGGTIIEIEGDPNLTIRIDRGVTDQPQRVVAARVVNLLEWLLAAPPGLRSPAELPLALRLG